MCISATAVSSYDGCGCRLGGESRVQIYSPPWSHNVRTECTHQLRFLSTSISLLVFFYSHYGADFKAKIIRIWEAIKRFFFFLIQAVGVTKTKRDAIYCNVSQGKAANLQIREPGTVKCLALLLEMKLYDHLYSCVLVLCWLNVRKLKMPLRRPPTS